MVLETPVLTAGEKWEQQQQQPHYHKREAGASRGTQQEPLHGLTPGHMQNKNIKCNLQFIQVCPVQCLYLQVE